MISFEGDLNQFLQKLDPQLVRKAQISALRKIRGKAATQLSKEARGIYNTSARTIRDAMERRIKFKISGDQSAAYLNFVGRRIGLINFGAKIKKVSTPRGRRFGATTKLYKNKPRHRTKRGFIAAGKGGNVHIYQRQEAGQKPRLPLEAMYGPSVPQMLAQEGVSRGAEEMVAREYPIELIRQIDYRLSKL